MKKIDVLRVQNPNALRLPAVKRLLERAFAKNSIVKSVPDAIAELDFWVVRGDAGLFIVREDGTWVAMAFAQWGESAFAPHMTVIHVYNEGSKQALRAVNRALVAYAQIGGYDSVLTLDVHDKPRAFAAVFREGGPPVKLGSAYYFTLGGDDGRIKLETEGHDPTGVPEPPATAGE